MLTLVPYELSAVEFCPLRAEGGDQDDDLRGVDLVGFLNGTSPSKFSLKKFSLVKKNRITLLRLVPFKGFTRTCGSVIVIFFDFLPLLPIIIISTSCTATTTSSYRSLASFFLVSSGARHTGCSHWIILPQ